MAGLRPGMKGEVNHDDSLFRDWIQPGGRFPPEGTPLPTIRRCL